MVDTSEPQDMATTDSVYAGRLSDAPIGAVKPPQGIRWLTILLAFMRIAALYWLLKGVLHWTVIIGLSDVHFPGLRLSRQGVIIIFAVADLVAAVGLWLTSSWGAAVWLVLLFAEVALPFFLPDMAPAISEALVPTGFGVAYLFFVWKAFVEERRE